LVELLELLLLSPLPLVLQACRVDLVARLLLRPLQ
jgi:hypothetical protein